MTEIILLKNNFWKSNCQFPAQPSTLETLCCMILFSEYSSYYRPVLESFQTEDALASHMVGRSFSK